MDEAIKHYIDELNVQFRTGVAHEHSYRGPLQNLLATMLPKGYTVVNEPTREKCGAPDYIILKGNTPIAYIEAKNLLDKDLDGRRENKEQFDRYKSSLDHIVFTDYLDFHLYENGEPIDAVRLAGVRGDKIVLNDENVDRFTQMVDHIAKATPQRITSSRRLASMMAGKARLLANVLEKALSTDEGSSSELTQQMKVFQEFLIHDLTEKTFADIYAQTIAYGLFSARLNDPTPEDFSRTEANELIPKSNPFLRRIFNDIAGYNVDSRIAWIIDDLVEVFRVTDMTKVMHGFGGTSGRTDPMMHFYEDFLGQYDPTLRDKRGVYYTPQPVVDFIVRAVDDILKRDFNLPMGLADNSKIDHKIKNDWYRASKKKGDTKTINETTHRVQILDPATGTGTFLATVIRHIHANMEGQWGVWKDYVEQHLLPRLNGFELMMAPYTIAHLKLGMVLGETGYTSNSDKRLRVYLTNSLEEHNADTGTLFAAAISQEASEASRIKRDTPVMVMMGNPPYSVSSSNNSDYITRLLDSYKHDLRERNIQPLSDDYIKFIRLGQEYIARNGEGILAFICNNSFIDGIIHRQMRKELMQKFDEIYVLDLHGNSRKKESAPDGSKDENVFDIMSGVSINIFVKKSQDTSECHVYHYDLFGSRENKYNFLLANNLKSVQWTELSPEEPYYFFVPKDFSIKEEYEKGFKIEELMTFNTSGVKTHHDKELVANTPFNTAHNAPYTYRPLDNQWIDYDLSKVVRHRYDKMRHIIDKDNVSLIIGPQGQVVGDMPWNVVFLSNKLVDTNVFYRGGGILFPLYLYSEDGTIRKPNLNPDIVKRIAAIVDNASERCLASTHMQRSEALPTFVDLHEHIQIKTDALPHWHRPGKTQFVTFRLYDSMPQERLIELKAYKDEWKKMHPLPWDDATKGKYDKEVRRKTEKWLDNGYGSCILKKPEVRKIVSDAMLHYHGQRYYIHHFVIMPNHIHLLVTPLADNTINEDLGSVKRFSANAINKMMGTKGEVWQRLVFDHMVRSEESYKSLVEYIKKNPKNLPADSFTLFDAAEVDNASERCMASTHMQRSEALPTMLPTVDPQELFDYIYAVLHSPAYRAKYKEFLKIDFPRIPYPENAEQYHRLSAIGGQLRRLHLMEEVPQSKNATFNTPGDNLVDKPTYKNGCVWINKEQCFADVSETAWNFYIGGYQPAQKWLKDRRGRTLSYKDVQHYRCIITILNETAQIMGTLDV